MTTKKTEIVRFTKQQLDRAGKELANLVKATGATGLLKETAIAELTKRQMWPEDFSGRGQVLKKARVEKHHDANGAEIYFTKEHAPKREKKSRSKKGNDTSAASVNEQTMTFENPDAASVTYDKEPRTFKGGIKRVIIILGTLVLTVIGGAIALYM